jgi:predicted TIM-barrel fold metal-dependent hydrolase
MPDGRRFIETAPLDAQGRRKLAHQNAERLLKLG